jgi:flagellar M-ring protein FliF
VAGATKSPAGATAAANSVTAAAKNVTTTTVAKTTTTAKTTKAGSTGPAATTTTAPGSSTGGAATTTVPSYTQLGSSQQDVVSEVTKTVASAPGALERLSVAVFVNSSVKGVTSSQVTQLVSAAAGLQTSRGDTIQVAFVPFDQTQAKQAAASLVAQAKAKSQTALMGEARDGAVVLTVLALLMFALRRITKTTRVPLVLPAGYQPLELEPAQEYDEDEDEETMALSPGPSRERVPVPVESSAPLQSEVNQLGQMIEREPERIAEMLRSWLETGPGDR